MSIHQRIDMRACPSDEYVRCGTNTQTAPKKWAIHFCCLIHSPAEERDEPTHLPSRDLNITGEGPKRGGEEEAISAETSLGGGEMSFFSPTTLSLR